MTSDGKINWKDLKDISHKAERVKTRESWLALVEEAKELDDATSGLALEHLALFEPVKEDV